MPFQESSLEVLLNDCRADVDKVHGMLRSHNCSNLGMITGRFYARYAEIQRLLSVAGPTSPNYNKYTQDITTLMAKLEGYLEALEALTTPSQSSSETTSTAPTQGSSNSNVDSAYVPPPIVPQSSYKLKALDPPKYSGDIKGWKAFYESFTACVESQPYLSDQGKMSYLVRALKGKAARAIEGLDSTAENYQQAWEILKERFGDKHKLIAVYYGELDDLIPSRHASGQRANLDAIRKLINNMKALNMVTEQDCLKNRIIPKFSKETVIATLTTLESEFKNESFTVEQLLSALSATIRIQERCETFLREEDNYESNSSSSSLPKKRSLAGALVGGKSSSSSKHGEGCVFCNSANHASKDCLRFRTLRTRRDCLDRKRRCVQCLVKGHRGSSCRKKNQTCALCNKKGHGAHLCVEHLISITTPSTSSNKDRSKSPEPEKKTKRVNGKKGNFLETFLCRIETVDGFKLVRGVLDSCSEYSYIEKDLASSLGLRVTKPTRLNLCLFGTPNPHSVRSGEVRVTLSHHISDIEKTFDFMITPCVTGPMDTSPPPNVVKRILPGHLTYADPDIFNIDKRPIQILIGNSYQFDIFFGDIKRLPSNVVLRKSIFGWVPSGEVRNLGIIEPHSSASLTLLCTAPTEKPTLDHVSMDLDGILGNLWSLEAIGIKASESDVTDDLVLEKFRQTVRFENNRYVVRWPWKQENPQLPSNFRMAMARLNSLYERSTHELMTQYQKLLSEQLNLGIIEPAPMSTPFLTHYLPHRALFRNNKIRVVYDASAKTKTGRSLNDLLHRGPVLLEGLVGLIINFRIHPIALTADIEKAFLQISLNEVDRDCVRFLWLKNISAPPSKENLIVYRFARVPFGVISSPFLLNIVIQEHLTTGSTNSWNLLVKNKFYVDNLVVSVQNTSSALNLYSSVTSKLAEASFNLRDWTSNDSSFLQAANLPLLEQNAPPISILGLNWNRQKDTLSVKSQDLGPANNLTSITKRIALKYYASIFDPLGLFTPCTLELKLFIQECWKGEYDWDSPLPADFVARWLKLYQESLEIPKCAIPRRYWEFPSVGKISLHIFCDASKKAYACCAYLTYFDDKSCSSASALVYAKARAAPVAKKKNTSEMTIPRLELLAVLIGKRTSNFLKAELDLKIERTVLWTDATTVLQWLNSSAVLPKFVENRISEIRRTPDLIIRHVPTNQNPADVATRGCVPLSLINDDLWWKGPSWISHEGLWPQTPNTTEIYSTSSVTLATGVYKSQSLLSDHLEERFSNWNAYVRVFKNVNILRFANKNPPYLSSTEQFQLAERTFVKEIQKKYFLDELTLLKKGLQPNFQLELYLDKDGLIRCKGRLQNAELSWDSIHPILLPRDSRLTVVYIRKLHSNNLHIGCTQLLAELRKKFWVTKARSLISSIIHKCVICRRWEGGPYQLPPLPPLPLVRVREAAPFLHTGLDYLGNLTIQGLNGDETTVYVALFTCLVTRAVHLELARNLTADEFLMCLIRFSSRRRCPKFIISDNASNFTFVQPLVGKKIVEITDYKVDNYLSTNNIHWKFIPQYSPWHGGAYERLVSLVKRSLKKTYGTQYLDYVQLNTALVQIENTINSRPLTYVSSEEILSPLTPNHFLKPGDVNVSTPMEISAESLSSNRANLISAWEKTKGVVEAFWEAFRSNYLLSLRERHCAIHHPPKGSLPFVPQKGDIVLIKEPSKTRINWKFGVVERTDKRKALAHVRSNKKVLLRSINHLYPLELPSPLPSSSSSNAKRPKQT